MEKNKFILEPSTSEVINKFYIKSGYGTIDCNYERVDRTIKGSSDNYDQTNGRDILKAEFIYLPDFPSKIISYEKMLEYGKDKYYWDSLNQKLYKFKIKNYPVFNYKGEVESILKLPKENVEFGDSYLVISYNYKGEVENIEDLPSNKNQISDVYLVTSVDTKYYWSGKKWVQIYEYYSTTNTGKKYYWTGEKWEIIVKPFIAQKQVIVGCYTSPSAGGVDVSNEFSKTRGIWEEVILDHAISSYITIKGHPSQYAPLPYLENTYYYDSVHDKYYTFTSNYTLNINNWYYDKTITNSVMLRYAYNVSAWTTVNDALVLDGSPNELITVTDGETTETQINIDDINKTVCYCDKNTDKLYYFDYGQYFEQILYSGVIYERPFEFYRKLQDVFLDISSSRKILTKDIFYVHGHPKKVKNPKEERYYFDTKNQKYYEYSESAKTWTEVSQDNVLVPQTYFPHTNGEIIKQVTLAYYDIIDCYTKKEVDKLIPVIPGYISAFENDIGYIYEHQDISGKQDVLSEEQLIAANSGINSELVTYFDNVVNIVNNKANKASTLNGYGITDAYTTNELEEFINLLTDQLNRVNRMRRH